MRSILILHPAPAVRFALQAALSDDRVLLAAERGDAEGWLAQEPDVVVADGSLGRKLVKDCERLSREPTVVLLSPATDPEAAAALAELAAQGHRFRSVDSSARPDALAARVQQLLDGRSSPRLSPSGAIRCRLRIDGRRHDLPVADVSSSGVGLVLGLEIPVERFRPGALLEEVALFRGRRRLTSDQTATVQHLHKVSAPGESPLWHLGLTFSARRRAPGPARIADRIQIQAMLLRALQRGEPVQVRGPSGAPLRLPATSVSLEPTHLLIDLPSVLEARTGDVVQISFDFGGTTWTGSSAVRGPGGGTRSAMSLPAALVEAEPRAGLRFIAPADAGWEVTVRCPFTLDERSWPLTRIDGERVRVACDASEGAFPPGLRLHPVALTSARGEVMIFRAEIESCEVLDAASPGRREVTLRMLEVSRELAGQLRNAAVHARYPRVVDLDAVPFSSVWQLMEETKRHFPDYPFGDAGVLQRIGSAQAAVERSHGELGKAFLYCEKDRPVGHSSGLRAYSRTWLFGHLAAHPSANGELASRELSAMGLEYGESLPDVEFLRYIWLTENRWPNRFTCWLMRRMRRENATRVVFYHSMRRALNGSEPLPVGSGPVRPATRADLEALEATVRRRGDLLGLVTDDLGADEVTLEALGRRYAEFGLERRREVVVVDGLRGPAAWGLIDHMTAGLCWPELTNAMRIVPGEASPEHLAQARQALGSYSIQEAASRGRPAAMVLAADEEVAFLERLGFESLGRTGEWTFPKRMVGEWDDLTRALTTERFQRRARTRTAEGAEADEMAA